MHKSIIRDIEQRDLKVRKNEGQDIYSINRLELTHVNWIDNPEDKNSNLFASIILSGPNTDSASNSDGGILKALNQDISLLLEIRKLIVFALQEARIKRPVPQLKLKWSDSKLNNLEL